MKTRKVVNYVRLSKEVVERLDQMAEREETNRSTIIRRLILDALRAEIEPSNLKEHAIG